MGGEPFIPIGRWNERGAPFRTFSAGSERSRIRLVAALPAGRADAGPATNRTNRLACRTMQMGFPIQFRVVGLTDFRNGRKYN
ncbi:hypothetical protein ABIA14_005320 [Sinorhizobium fredii]